MKKLIFLFLFFSQTSFAQSNQAKEILQKIEISSDTIQSVFSWVTENVKYDVNKLLKRKDTPISKRFTTYDSVEEQRQTMFKDVVRKKKGVCEDYSILFDVLVQELGYESFIIAGYTKRPNGKLSSSMGHTWNAVKVNNQWKLYDPTWGSGVVNEKNRFVKKYNPKWFDIDPQELLNSHIPYDPIWQLRAEPMSYKDFENGNPIPDSTTSFDPEKAIAAYFSKDQQGRYQAQLDRSNAMGNGTGSMMRWRKTIVKRIKNHELDKKVDTLNEAGDKFNQATDLFNAFVIAQKKKFKGSHNSISTIREKLIQAKANTTSALTTFESVSLKEPKRRRSLKDAIKKSKSLLSSIDRAMDYLDKK